MLLRNSLLILFCCILCVAELSCQSWVIPPAVDLAEEDSSDDVNVRLSSFRLSPIGSDDVLEADSQDCTTLTDTNTEPGRDCTDQPLHTDCDETDAKVTVDVDDVFVNGNNSSSLLSSCENPVTNVA